MYSSFRTMLFCAVLVPSVSLAEASKTYVIVNNAYKGRVNITLTSSLQPCITAALLREWGIRYADVAKMYFSVEGCVMPDALQQREILHFYDPDAQLLTLVIPPTLANNMENGVTTSRWDDGVNAAFISYQLNYARYGGANYRDADRRSSLYADLTTGVNLGGWRLRYEPVYQSNLWGESEWYNERAVMFRDIKAWRALLTVGDSTTPSELFDNVKYRGMSLVSDDRMLPDGLRPFSPWIRGYARSNAKVEIRQNGDVIYQTFVSPGAFVLKDIYPSASDGDIEITIKESDGTETERKVPYSAMPNLVLRYHWKYDATIGKYQPYHGIEQQQPLFGQGAVSYGLPEKITLYGGVMVSDIYRSAALGIGKSMDRWGAISTDYSIAIAHDPRTTVPNRGGMARLRYAKAIPEWESSFTMLAQYYPKQRYRDFSEAIEQQSTYWWDWEDGVFVGDVDAEKKYRLEARYNQYLSDSDSLYLTLVREALRGKERGETSVELGYSVTWGDVDISLYGEYSRTSYGNEQSQIGLSFSLLSGALSLPGMRLNYDHALVKNGADSRRVGFSGTALSDYSLSYDVSTSQSQDTGSGQDLNASYQYNAGSLRLGYSQGQGFHQQNMELTGSIVAHQEGVTLGQTLGETIAIVSVPATAGVGVDNQYGVTTDWRGYAVVSTLTPYRVNRLSLNTFNLPEGIDVPEPENEVVPTAGAIMFSRFTVKPY
ncbi:fimbria/pilus outer membrane usher protein [Enterobacter mori]|uniref:fimbria/pilus outer membrane usher protein n=1 Tax=Enterobacter mori TaxID=539813 RepID=UPI001B8A8D76|nr:fimbria/pilus outer membrane usher protein [Enterobacter mori]MBS3046375.1 fimbria/pilus outer membrane usher protein [Enterobacter mori]